ILYLVWVLIYLQRHRIKKFFYPKAKLPPIPPIYLDVDDVMGKTKTQLSQVTTNDDTLGQFEKPIENAITFAASKEDTRSAMVENHELDSVFSDSPEPMDLDIECEYEETELLEEEDLNCFVEDETFEPARGIQYDEMENLVQVIQQTSLIFLIQFNLISRNRHHLTNFENSEYLIFKHYALVKVMFYGSARNVMV
ncbi:MAG: hypothetical protein WCJ61_10195, partial [Paludibacter sp.]